MSRSYRGISDSQANADALARREATWSAPHRASVQVAWDFHRREPRDLRDAVRMARKAFADEVPGKLHDSAIGDDGTPRMTRQAEGYIFGRADADDAARDLDGTPDLVGYYHAPFRACLDSMAKGDPAARRRAAIVQHVTIGQQKPGEAAIKEGAHPLDAKLVAWDALCSFLRSMTDLRLHVREEAVA